MHMHDSSNFVFYFINEFYHFMKPLIYKSVCIFIVNITLANLILIK